MSLLKYAVVAAIGYFAGQPSGRRQLERLRLKATEVVRSPQVEDLKQRGKEIAGERASTVLSQVRHKSADSSTTHEASGVVGGRPSGPVAGSSAETEFSGRTIAEERQAARTGVIPPSPVGRVADDEGSPSGP
jgi:hypothetical protein